MPGQEPDARSQAAQPPGWRGRCRAIGDLIVLPTVVYDTESSLTMVVWFVFVLPVTHSATLKGMVSFAHN